MPDVHSVIEQTFQRESRVVIAALLSTWCDFELAEDCLQDALLEALRVWPQHGVPNNPGAWIMTTARHKVIDRLRRANTVTKYLPALHALNSFERQAEDTLDGNDIPDERLSLIFTCCHPSLAQDAQVALTLQTVVGLPTESIARAFLVAPTTMAQRLVRAKHKIRDAGIPYQVPPATVLGERLDAVLTVIYLIFNAGYVAPVGERLMQDDLCEEAIRLAWVLLHLLRAKTQMGDHAETLGLLALMLLHHARRDARTDPDGQMILLEQQDRTRWNSAMIAEGVALLDHALTLQQRGAYQMQAAIAALHADASDSAHTDWRQIALLYRALLELKPSPVIELNWAVAMAMADGIEKGLRLFDAMAEQDTLNGYYLFHAARADLLRRLDRRAEAHAAYRRALALCDNASERAFLSQRIDETAP